MNADKVDQLRARLQSIVIMSVKAQRSLEVAVNTDGTLNPGHVAEVCDLMSDIESDLDAATDITNDMSEEAEL